MKIIKLISENVRKIKAVEITPKSNVVQIQGKNSNGKSSVLDSIMYALGGSSKLPNRTINESADDANIQIELDNFIIKKHIYKTTDGDVKSSLKVMNRDGAVYSSPQTMINKMISNLSYDPVAFERMKANEQKDILKKIIKLDTSKLESEIVSITEERKLFNYKVKELTIKLNSLTEPEVNLPNLPIDTTQIENKIKEKQEKKNKLNILKVNLTNFKSNRSKLEKEIRDAEVALRKLKESLIDINNNIDNNEKESAILAVNDINDLDSQLADTKLINTKIQHRNTYQSIVNELDEFKLKSEDNSEKITNKKKEIDELIKNANYPLEGLELKDEIYYNGIPFNQCSQSERLLISLAIMESLNNELKICLVREGSRLDASSKKLLIDWADKKDIQIWLEEIREEKEGDAFYIVEGELK